MPGVARSSDGVQDVRRQPDEDVQTWKSRVRRVFAAFQDEIDARIQHLSQDEPVLPIPPVVARLQMQRARSDSEPVGNGEERQALRAPDLPTSAPSVQRRQIAVNRTQAPSLQRTQSVTIEDNQPRLKQAASPPAPSPQSGQHYNRHLIWGEDEAPDEDLGEDDKLTITQAIKAIPRLPRSGRWRFWGCVLICLPLVGIIIGTAVSQSGTASVSITSQVSKLMGAHAGHIIGLVAAVWVLLAFVALYAQVPLRSLLMGSRRKSSTFVEREKLHADIQFCNELGLGGDLRKWIMMLHTLVRGRQQKWGILTGLELAEKYDYPSLPELKDLNKAEWGKLKLPHRMSYFWAQLMDSINCSNSCREKADPLLLLIFFQYVYRVDEVEFKEILRAEKHTLARRNTAASEQQNAFKLQRKQTISLLYIARSCAREVLLAKLKNARSMTELNLDDAAKTEMGQRAYAQASQRGLLSALEYLGDIRRVMRTSIDIVCKTYEADLERCSTAALNNFDHVQQLMLIALKSHTTLDEKRHSVVLDGSKAVDDKTRSDRLTIERRIYSLVTSDPSWGSKTKSQRRMAMFKMSTVAFVLRDRVRVRLQWRLQDFVKRAQDQGSSNAMGLFEQFDADVFHGQFMRMKFGDILNEELALLPHLVDTNDLPAHDDGKWQQILEGSAKAAWHQFKQDMELCREVYQDRTDHPSAGLAALTLLDNLTTRWAKQDKRLHLRRMACKLGTAGNILGWANIFANAITVLFGGIMGLECFQFLHFTAGFNWLTWMLAGLFVLAGILGSASITRQKTRKLMTRLGIAFDDWQQKRRLKKAIKENNYLDNALLCQSPKAASRGRLGLALTLGSFTTIGATIFAAFSGYYLLHGLPNHPGLDHIIPGLAHAPHWVSYVLGGIDGLLTLICAGCLYNAFCIRQLSKKHLNDGVLCADKPKKQSVLRRMGKYMGDSMVCLFALVAALIQCAVYAAQAFKFGGTSHWLVFIAVGALSLCATVTFFCTFSGSIRKMFGVVPARLDMNLDAQAAPKPKPEPAETLELHALNPRVARRLSFEADEPGAQRPGLNTAEPWPSSVKPPWSISLNAPLGDQRDVAVVGLEQYVQPPQVSGAAP